MNGVGVIFAAAFLFGAMAVCVHVVEGAMPPTQVAFVRFAGALALLLASAGPRALRPASAPIRMLVARGLLGAVAIVLWFHGIQTAGAALAVVLHATYPVFATLFAVMLLGERFSARAAAALAANLGGVALVVGPGLDVSSAATRGELYSLAAAVFAGAAVTTARHLRARESATVVTTWFMLTGALVTAPALAAGLHPLPASTLAALAGMVLTSTAGQWLLHHGLGHTTATRGSLAAATSVVTAAVLEAVCFGRTLPLHTVLGACLMIGAVALAAEAAKPAAPWTPAVEPVTDD